MWFIPTPQGFPNLLDENGKRKTFERFLKDVQKVDKTYNEHYLRAEYNFVTASAQMAARWEQIEAEADRYHLQYRTAADSRVREEHAALHGITLPPSDPFWDTHYPPNGWNCRCRAIQVRKTKYAPTPQGEVQARVAKNERDQRSKKAEMFRFNSGKQRKTVPDYNAYTISKCTTCPRAQGKGKLSLAKIEANELCSACALVRQCETLRYTAIKQYPNGGCIHKHHLVKESDSDYAKLLEVANFFAAQGKEVKLTPKRERHPQFVYENIYSSLIGTPYEGKCPDLLIDGEWYEHEGFVTDNPMRAFSNMMGHGLKQSSRLIIDKPDLTDAFMKRSINNRINNGILINEVWLREADRLRLLYKKSEE